MSDGLRRFLHLERPRKEPIAPDVPPLSRGRFDAVDSTPDEIAAAPAPDAAAGEVGGRFSEPPLRAPDVATAAPDVQPFVRCCRCDNDNSVYAERCSQCTAALDTPEQRAFNERLWAARRAEAHQLDDEVRRLRESAARAEEEAYRARRQMGEVIAREVGRQERYRLDREGGWASPPEGRWGMDEPVARDRRPLGLRLLFGIADPGRRLLAIAAVVSVFAFLIAAAVMSPALRNLLWIALFLFSVFFAPRNRRWR